MYLEPYIEYLFTQVVQLGFVVCPTSRSRVRVAAMGKHNGKARNSGLKVGSMLLSKQVC